MASSCCLLFVPLRSVRSVRSLRALVGCAHGGRQESAGEWCKEVHGSKELLSL